MTDDPRLTRLRDELVADGLVDGTDFAVTGAGSGVHLGSEVVVLRPEGSGWLVAYSDMGRERELVRSDDWEQVRSRFVREAHELAAGRGRGPDAGPGRTAVPLSELRERRRDSS